MSSRREILIDAYNIMFAHPKIGPLVRRDLERARDEFLALVVQLRPADGSRVVVVFDSQHDPAPATSVGRTGTAYSGGVQVVFARDSADAWIRERIRAHADPSALTIVTSDREILETARAHGAATRRASDFLALPERRRARMRDLRASEKPEHLSQREIDEWERLFGERSEEDEQSGESPS